MADDGFGHERPVKGATDVWLTPKPIIDLLGPFDLDPCAATDAPWPTADKMLTVEDDGLSHEWSGLVWCNPPYSNAWVWLERLANHGDGIALIFARTETAGFHKTVWQRADSIAFPRRRISFVAADGTQSKSSAGAPSCYVAYGQRASRRLHRLAETAIVNLIGARRA